MLEVNIRKRLKSFDLEASFTSGEGITGILGQSGSGKSMILKCIAGIETPDQGYIRLNGETLFDSEQGICVPTRKRNIGYMFQDYALFPNMTVRKNILCGNKAISQSELSTLMADLGILALADEYPNRISRGQQQRVAIARLMVSKPKMMLLDEPFSALDENMVWQMEKHIDYMIEKEKTPALFVSHSRDEILQMCQRAVVINEGKVIKDDSCEKIFDRPDHLSLARLCGYVNISKVALQQEVPVAEAFGFALSDEFSEADYITIDERDIRLRLIGEDTCRTHDTTSTETEKDKAYGITSYSRDNSCKEKRAAREMAVSGKIIKEAKSKNLYSLTVELTKTKALVRIDGEENYNAFRGRLGEKVSVVFPVEKLIRLKG